ncbi:hypothetical protein FGO68_gene11274 [Halteria grandinella]|uniref:Uncharacterized protein n=1 Tax=Halteria grandinella TaxID=5974 RepID=A0A8J8NTG7_HALGN|nr:hypothetical protein FGO68_gene11274 [Halteria grandinella]
MIDASFHECMESPKEGGNGDDEIKIDLECTTTPQITKEQVAEGDFSFQKPQPQSPQMKEVAKVDEESYGSENDSLPSDTETKEKQRQESNQLSREPSVKPPDMILPSEVDEHIDITEINGCMQSPQKPLPLQTTLPSQQQQQPPQPNFSQQDNNDYDQYQSREAHVAQNLLPSNIPDKLSQISNYKNAQNTQSFNANVLPAGRNYQPSYQ